MYTDVLFGDSGKESEKTILIPKHLEGLALKKSVLRQYYLIGIHKFEGNLSEASRYLGLSIKTLRKEVNNDPLLKETRDAYLMVVQQNKEPKPIKEKKEKKRNLLPPDTSRGRAEDLILNFEINKIKQTSTYRLSTDEEKKEILDRVAKNITSRPYSGPIQ